MLTHVHKVIHLVVDIFEQGLETIQKRQGFTECTGHWSHSDRTLGVLRPVSGSRERIGVGLRPDAGWVRLAALVW